MIPRVILGACAIFLGAVPALADTFTTLRGDKLDGQLKGLYGDSLLLGANQRTLAVDLDSLDNASLLKVAQFLAAQPAAAPAWSQSTSKVAKAVSKKLQVLRDGKFVNFDPAGRPEPEFYVIYYGAYWCGPCRRFSPSLVEAYHRLKAIAPDRFEVIFVSSDHDDYHQLTYAKEVSMPWPILKLSQARSVRVFEQWRADGIPSVVVLTRDGDALFHSYRGKEYLGPNDPLDKFTELLETTSGPAASAPRAGRHRLAMAQHLQAAKDGDLKPQPYLVSLDRSRLRTLATTEVKVQLTISPTGQVDDIEFLTQLDVVNKDQLRRSIEKWLFLPAVANGVSRQSVVVLPIDFPAS